MGLKIILIAYCFLLAVVAALVIGKEEVDILDTMPNTKLSFDNHVVISSDNYTMALRNEATENARSILIRSLTSNEHDSIKQYIPVQIYSSDEDITDRFEYHSLIEAKSLAIAIRIMLLNNNPEYLTITSMIVKSEECRDLFKLNLEESIEIQPYQRLYIVWYIQIAGDNITEAGISQLLQGLAYGNTNYKHALLKDIVLMDSEGSILPFYPLYFNIKEEDRVLITDILKNKTAKDFKIKTIAVRNTDEEYIFAYDLEEAIEAKAYSKITVKVSIWS